MAEIKLKALIDKEKDKLLFVESNADLVDMLFSFLTMPIGTIIKLTGKQPSATTIGSMNNLYESVENLSVNYFWTSECRDMLLSPRSGAEAYLKNIKPTLENYSHFFCNGKCTSALKLMSYYKHARCPCGNYMDNSICLTEDVEGGVFVKGLTRYIISDDLLIFPLSTIASFSLLLKQDVTTVNALEEKDFLLGKNEILNLLKSLFASKNPLTETLMKKGPLKEPKETFFYDRRATKKRKIVQSSGEHGSDGPLPGCARDLYENVQKLDSIKLISDESRQFLLCPKAAAHFGVHKELLGVEEVAKQYFCAVQGVKTFVAVDKSRLKDHDSCYGIQELTLLDPKSSYGNKGIKTSVGYVKEATMFTITDDLVIKTSSAISGAAILEKLSIPFSDIEERTVNVGKEEAISLLVASFISKSPLTDVFIRKVPKEEE